MKKVLFLLLFAVTGMAARAQTLGTDTLRRIDVKGDPMLGTKDRKMWKGQYATVDNSNMGPYITLYSTDHIFTNKGTKVGIYQGDSLLWMSSYISFTRAVQDGTRLQMLGGITSEDSIPGGTKDEKYKGLWHISMSNMLHWVKDHDATLRIVTHTYGEYIYDLRIKFREE